MKEYERKYFNGKEWFKLGTVEMFREDAQKVYENKEYILTRNSVYQVFYSIANDLFYAQKVYYQKGAKFTLPGMYFTFDAKYINNIIGFKLLNEN